jgi:DNA-3-methyladenine glycosylase
MYGPPGMAFVYFTYGNHWMLNFVTERKDFPAAVLIRGVEPLQGIATMRRRRMVARDYDLTNGPGKITHAFGITGSDNGISLRGPRLVVTRGTQPCAEQIATSGRIGVGEGHERLWRFFYANNPWVSKYRFGTKSYLKSLQSKRAA